MVNIKRAISIATVLPLVAIFAAAAIIGNSPVANADGNGSPNECLGTNANVLGSQTGTADLVTTDVGAGKVVDGVCIKSGKGMFNGVKHSGVLDNGTYETDCYKVEGVGTQTAKVTRLKDSNDCKGISHIDVVTRDISGICELPSRGSVAQWLASNGVDGSVCFDYEVTQACGSLDVQFTENLSPYTYSFRYAIGDQTPNIANWAGDGSLPVGFGEDENGGSVDVTYYVVGPESDYFTGSGIPNIWDGNGETVAVVTDCESESEDEDPDEEGQVLAEVTNNEPAEPTAAGQVVAPVGAVDAGAGGAGAGAAAIGLVTSVVTAGAGLAYRRFGNVV